MTEVNVCELFAEQVSSYVEGTLPESERKSIERHLTGCEICRDGLQQFRAVQNLAEYVQLSATSSSQAVVLRSSVDRAVAAPADSAWQARIGAAPWWFVSCTLHVLVIALASLVSMAIDMPRGDDAVVMITELQPRTTLPDEPQTKPKSDLTDVMERKETPATDLNSREYSDIVVPPDILAKAELGDHFETINPDLPDTHSALGNPDSKSFHSVEGNTDAAGGGGMNGLGMDDLIGFGGAAGKGSGGGWGGGDGTGTGVGSGPAHGSFGQRGGAGRKLMVKRHGGSKASENAVDAALHWLAYHQEPDGHWDTVKYGARQPWGGAGFFKPDTAMTSLALLAFLGAGHTEKVGQYKDNVQRAVAWLIDKQQPNGLIFAKGDEATGFGYTGAMATMALAEAAGMANVKSTREAAQKAVNYCTETHQNGEGSEKHAWRYYAKQSTEDISNSGWFVMALKSAKVAGLHVDHAAFEGAMKFLDKLEKKEPAAEGIDTGYGLPSEYGYESNADAELNYQRSAIGTLCRQFMGVKKEELQSSVELFVKKGSVPKIGRENLYYWYYGTLCVFQQGGEVWKKWNEGLQAALLPTQCKDGDDAGSWTATGNYAEAWGRVGQTALTTLCLEVYYRYLQIAPDK